MVSISSIIAPRNPSNLMVVDALNLAFRWKHKKQLDFKYDYLRTVESLSRSYDCGKIVIAADHGKSKYRRELLPTYKDNRRPEEQSAQEKEEFEQFFKEFEATLALLGEKYLVLRYKGVEADDIAAHIVKSSLASNTWLISSDRDWDLLVQEGVSRFSYITRKEITTLTWEEHYDVPQEKYLSYKCLMGDKGDNIPGIPGIGPVKASQLLSEFDSAWEVYDACPLPGKYVYIKNINENKELIPINYELMDLISFCEDAIGPDNLRDLDESLRKFLDDN